MPSLSNKGPRDVSRRRSRGLPLGFHRWTSPFLPFLHGAGWGNRDICDRPGTSSEMNRAVLHAVLIACLLIPALAAGGAAVPPDMEDLVAGRGNGSPGAGGTPLPLFPDISFPQRTLAAREWYERGFAFTNEERYSEAVMAYEQALAADRSQLNAWYYLGDALFRLGRSREALLAFGNATAIDPDFVDAYFYESRIYGELGLPEEETDALRRGLEAADRRKAKEDASIPPQAPGPLTQPLPAGLAILATGITAICLTARRCNKGL
jgi:hypothetical protein